MDKTQKGTKVKTYLGFAAKTRGLVSGSETCLDAIRKGKALLTLIDFDASDGTKERFQFTCASHNVCCVVLDDSSVGKSIGKPERKVVCITDKRFAQAIINDLDLGDEQ